MKNKGKAYKGASKVHRDFLLIHWGILGQKRGVRRYQDEYGNWTEEGKARRREREGYGDGRLSRKERKFQEQKEKAISNGDVNFAYKNRYKFTAEDYDRLEKVVNEKLKYSELKRRSDMVKYNKIQQISSLVNMSLSTANNTLALANNISKLSGSGRSDDRRETKTFSIETDDDGNPINAELTGMTKQYTDNGVRYTRVETYKKKNKGE